jgi:hypothetical protein
MLTMGKISHCNLTRPFGCELLGSSLYKDLRRGGSKYDHMGRVAYRETTWNMYPFSSYGAGPGIMERRGTPAGSALDVYKSGMRVASIGHRNGIIHHLKIEKGV